MGDTSIRFRSLGITDSFFGLNRVTNYCNLAIPNRIKCVPLCKNNRFLRVERAMRLLGDEFWKDAG